MAKTYKAHHLGGHIVLNNDEVISSIPIDPANRDYREYLAWEAEPGNDIEPADLLLPPPFVPDFGGDVDDEPTFRASSQTAVDNLRAYLGTPNASVTPLQTVQALKLLIRVVLFLVRRAL